MKNQRIIEDSPMSGLAKGERIDLGLAVMGMRAQPGERYTLGEIAAFAGCTGERIRQIERRALAKLRRRMPPEVLSELQHYFDGKH